MSTTKIKRPQQDWDWARTRVAQRLRAKEEVYVHGHIRIVEVSHLGITIRPKPRGLKGLMILGLGVNNRGRVHYRFYFRRRDEGGWELKWKAPDRPGAFWAKGGCRRCCKVYHLVTWKTPGRMTACGRAFDYSSYYPMKSLPRQESQKAQEELCSTCMDLTDFYDVGARD